MKRPIEEAEEEFHKKIAEISTEKKLYSKSTDPLTVVYEKLLDIEKGQIEILDKINKKDSAG